MSQVYTLVPLPDGPFAGLDPTTRLIFGLLWDRYKLSGYTLMGSDGECPYYDYDLDRLYCVWSHSDLARTAGVSERTVRRSLDTLRARDLITWRKARYSGACQYYIEPGVEYYLRRSISEAQQSGQSVTSIRSE